ncbi:hypothetical protein CCACVL1_01373 [Corchorus capsularis]|uniref:Uncharacterized protein n=1 Tax=Corchorus capsularis TaxID=210143 RepID=A0A1R3KJF1_COCAP|nr:hypothetical protein CCACVL1_01373 [Corchorus capsularis]
MGLYSKSTTSPFPDPGKSLFRK